MAASQKLKLRAQNHYGVNHHKRFIRDNPQRHNPNAVLPSNPYFTLLSSISKSPSILIEPFL
jgi:hypothetical protein